MDRLQRFNQLKEHPWIGREYARLKPEELDFCRAFINLQQDLSDDEFAFFVNRLGLAGELRGFKNPSLIWALLSQSIEPKVRKK